MLSSNEFKEFLRHIRENRITREDGKQLLGDLCLRWLLASGQIVHNPFTDRLENGGNTEDFYP